MPANMDVGNLFTDKFDADKTIQKLVDLEKSKSEKWENDKFLNEMRKKAWEGFQKKLKEIDAAVRSFYNPVTSPFRKMKTQSDQEKIMTATAESKVKTGEYEFKVLKLATPDIFRSDVLDGKTKLEPFQFELAYKEKTYKFNYKGGSLEGLAKMMNEQAPAVLTATVLKVDESHVVLHIEGKETGKENRLQFKGDLTVLEKIGLLGPGLGEAQTLSILDSSGWVSEAPVSSVLKGESILLGPGKRAEKTLSTPVKASEQKVLILKIRLTPKAQEKTSEPQKKESVSFEAQAGTIDRVWVGDSDIEGESLIGDPNFGLPPKEEFKAPEKSDAPFLSIQYQGGVEAFPFNYSPGEQWQEIRISLKDDFINRLSFFNPFTDQDLGMKDFKIQSPSGEGRVPKNSIAGASDAEIDYKGIQIIRPTNKVDDLIPGLSLYLHGVSDEKVKITVDWNFEEVKNKVMELVVMYNNAMDYVRNVTRRLAPKNQKQMTEWRESFKNMSAKEAEEKSKDGALYEGVLGADMTVGMVKGKLREIMLSPYETSAGVDLKFLTQMGIATQKLTGGATAEDRENMNAGFLDFSEEKFEKTLKDRFMAVQEFFFRDSTGNLIYDQGLAVKMTDTLKMIVPDSFRGEDGKVYPGLIRSKIVMLESSIKMNQKSIEQWVKHVEEYEARLRNQFAQMYKAMQKAKEQEGRIKNFGKGD